MHVRMHVCLCMCVCIIFHAFYAMAGRAHRAIHRCRRTCTTGPASKGDCVHAYMLQMVAVCMLTVCMHICFNTHTGIHMHVFSTHPC